MSICGPLLFSSNVNDISKVLNKVKYLSMLILNVCTNMGIKCRHVLYVRLN